MVTAVIPSADGRYLAVLHAVQPVPGPPGPGSSQAAVTAPGQPSASPSGPGLPIPAYLDIFDVEHPARPAARLTGAQTAVFSGDGAPLAEQVPGAKAAN